MRLAARTLLLTTIFFVLAFSHSAGAAEIDWADVEKQATEFLSAYIQIDTSNPPGNETAAAHFLAARFQQAGIESEIFESAPGRGSILTRIKGEGGARPIILLSHLDVVPASADGWDVAPFSGTVRDGYVYGRGALDCKGNGTVNAMALFLLRKAGIHLKRDVIFLATADEEAGGKLGAGWMVANHFDRFGDAEFVLNEGGHIEVLPNAAHVYAVAVSEKTPCWLRLTATGPAGHGSAPPSQTSVTRLIRALECLRSYQAPVRVTAEVQAYYAAIAPMQRASRRVRYENLRSALTDTKFRKEFLENPHDAALVRNTITPTVLAASNKTNVIPRSASADLDCRLLPGQDPQAFVRKVKDIIGDREISVDVLLNFPPSSSKVDTPLFAGLRRLAAAEGVAVVPSVLTGFTDSHYFRDQGIASYGFVPFALTEDEERRQHGVNERVATENLREGTRRLVEVLRNLDGQDVQNGKIER